MPPAGKIYQERKKELGRCYRQQIRKRVMFGDIMVRRHLHQARDVIALAPGKARRQESQCGAGIKQRRQLTRQLGAGAAAFNARVRDRHRRDQRILCQSRNEGLCAPSAQVRGTAKPPRNACSPSFYAKNISHVIQYQVAAFFAKRHRCLFGTFGVPFIGIEALQFHAFRAKRHQ